MELDDPSKYALGALFVVALHANELRAGAEVNHDSQAPWGEHSNRVAVIDPDAPEEEKQEAAARWDAFWGRDLVFSKGLLDRVLTKLGIDSTSWPGLKVVPEVAGEAGYGKIVQQYRGMLDAELKSLHAPGVHTQPTLNAPEHPQAAAGQLPQDLEGQVEEEDEDLAGDLKRGKLQSDESRPGRKTKAKNPDIGGLTLEEDKAPHKSSGGQAQAGEAKSTDAAGTEAPFAGQSGQDSKSASELARSVQGVGSGNPTPLAFLAVTQLLEACVSSLDMPKLQDIVKADPNSKKAAKVEVDQEKPGSEKAANVRWYDSRARDAVAIVADWLQVPWTKVLMYECMLAQQCQAPETQGDGKKQLTARERQVRALKIGAAAAGGGAILALTGGLAAPALAAVAGSALTTVGGASAAAAVTGLVGSSVGAAAIIAGFGAGGAHVVGGKMARRVGDVKEFGFREIPEDEGFHSYFSVAIPTPDAEGGEPQGASTAPPSKKTPGTQDGGQEGSWFSGSGSTVSSWMPWSKKPETDAGQLLPIPVSSSPRADPKLSRTIAVAGWIAAPTDFADQWRGLSSGGTERFSLVWESQELVALTRSMMDMLINQALSRTGKYLIEKFVIHGLVGAVALPMTVLNVSGLIDSTWAIVMNRSARAGELLAHLLMSGAHGDCPVTLVGHSMGARLVFYCLLELCRCQCKGIVQGAVMLGTPVDVIPERWVMARSVVSGRCVNAYSKNDWVLALSFRARQGTFRPAAGLGGVPVPGVENVDFSDLVNGHGDWVKHMDAVLRRLDLAQE